MRFTELDWAETPIGEISLRRRLDPQLKTDVYEVKLGDEYLMSSTFTFAEEELARLGLAELSGSDLDVVVGGLGLGCTAVAALEDPRVRSVHVVEYLQAVIDWHNRGLMPLSSRMTSDDRLSFVHGDFFALVASGDGFPGVPRCHALLLDIDHTPDHVLHPSHEAFYSRDGLTKLLDLIHPGGVFALWSDDPPSSTFLSRLDSVFGHAEGHVVDFPNPLTGGTSSNSVYVCRVSPV